MKILRTIFVYLLLALSISAYAGDVELMISVNKDPNCATLLSPTEIQNAVDALNFLDPTMSNCYVNSQVVGYVDYTAAGFPKDSPYYGIAFVRFQWNCDVHFQAHLETLQENGQYTLFSNPGIDPTGPTIKP